MWNPWATARDDEDLIIVFRQMPDEMQGGAYLPDDEGGVIVIDPRLTQAEKRSILAHELAHHRRGGGCAAWYMPRGLKGWQPRVTIDERQTDDEAVDNLIPPDELRKVCVEMEMACTHVEPWHIAEAFHVSEAMATRALQLQDKRWRERLDRFYDRGA